MHSMDAHEHLYQASLNLKISNDILLVVSSSCERDCFKINKSAAFGSQCLAVGCLIEDNKRTMMVLYCSPEY